MAADAAEKSWFPKALGLWRVQGSALAFLFQQPAKAAAPPATHSRMACPAHTEHARRQIPTRPGWRSRAGDPGNSHASPQSARPGGTAAPTPASGGSASLRPDRHTQHDAPLRSPRRLPQQHGLRRPFELVQHIDQHHRVGLVEHAATARSRASNCNASPAAARRPCTSTAPRRSRPSALSARRASSRATHNCRGRSPHR